MKIISKYLILAVSGACCMILVQAQHLNDTIRIREIEITGTPPADKAVADRSEIDQTIITRQAAVNLTELLSHHSGIFIRSTGRGTLATASLRGTDGSHTKIYWNDLEINSSMNGQTDLSLIPVFCLDEVDIFHGGSSLAYSSGALGGTLNLVSRPDWSGKTSGTLLQELASFSTYNLMFKTGVNPGKWYFNTRLFYNYSKNDYPFTNNLVSPARTERSHNGSYDRYGMLQEIYYRPGPDNLLSMKIWIQQSERNLPPVASYEGSGRTERQDDQSLRITAAWEKYYPLGLIEIKSGFSLTNLDYLLRSDKLDYTVYDSESREYGIYNTIEHKHYLSGHLMIRSQLRLNLNQVSMWEKTGRSGYNGTRAEASLMSSLYRSFGEHATAWLLIRQDASDNNLLPVMPSAGIEFDVPGSAGLRIKTNISRNFKKPDLNDLYWVPGGNPLLKPEKGLSGDLSLSLAKKAGAYNYSARIACFYASITDWITWSPSAYQYWMAGNLQHVITRGIESHLNIRASFSRYELALSGNYTFTRATSEHNSSLKPAPAGRQLIYVPRHAGNASLIFTCRDYFVNYILEYTGTRLTQTGEEIIDYEIILNPFLLNDLTAGKNFRLFRQEFLIQFAIRNIFNREYQMIYCRPMPGRNYSVLIGYKF